MDTEIYRNLGRSMWRTAVLLMWAAILCGLVVGALLGGALAALILLA